MALVETRHAPTKHPQSASAPAGLGISRLISRAKRAVQENVRRHQQNMKLDRHQTESDVRHAQLEPEGHAERADVFCFPPQLGARRSREGARRRRMQDVTQAKEQRRSEKLTGSHSQRRTVRAALQHGLVGQWDDGYREQAQEYCHGDFAAPLRRLCSTSGAGIITDGSVSHV